MSNYRHQKSITGYSAISVPPLRRNYLNKASENKYRKEKVGVLNKAEKYVVKIKNKKAHKTGFYGLFDKSDFFMLILFLYD